MLRKLARVAGFLGLWLPVGILAAWGGMYLYACFIALTAAGVPLKYVYESPGGPLTLFAESFSYDYRLNSLRLTRVSVQDPFRRNLIVAKALNVFDMVPGRRPIRVEGNDVIGTLERTPGGRFRFEDFLPKIDRPEDAGQAYSVELRRLSLLFIDNSATPPQRRWLSTARLQVDGVGSEWRASAALRVQDVGEIAVSARQDRIATVLSLKGSGLRLARALGHVAASPEGRELPELKNIRLDSLNASLAGFVDLRRDRTTWEVDVRAQGQGFAYTGEFAARNLSVRGRLTPKGFSGRASAEWQGGQAGFVGRWNWDRGMALSGSLEAEVASDSGLPPVLKRLMPKGATLREASFVGEVAIRGNDVRALGPMRVRALRWDFLKLADGSGVVDLSTTRVVLREARVTLNGTSATGAIEYNPQSGRIQGFVQAKGIQLKPFLRDAGLAALDGWADATAIIFGTVSRPEVAFRASGAGASSLKGQTTSLGRFETAGRYARGRVDLNRFSLIGPAGATTATGSWDITKDRIQGELLSTSVPLQAFFDGIGGSAAFSGTIRGTRKGIQASGTLEVFNGKVAGQDIPFVRGDVETDLGGLKATNVLAFKRGAQASGEGTIRFRDGALAGRFTVDGIDLTQYPPEGLAGIARITQGAITGTLASPVLRAAIEGENVVAQGVTLQKVSAKTEIAGGRLVVSEGTGSLDGGTVKAAGVFELGDDRGEFSVAFEGVPLRSLVGTRLPDATIEGLLNGDLTGRFDNLRISSLTARTLLSGLKLNDALIGNGSADFESSDGNLWAATVFLGDLSSYLQVPKITYNMETGALEGEVTADNLEAALLYGSARRYLADPDGNPLFDESVRAKLDTFAGRLDLDASLRGKLTDIDFDVRTLALTDLSIAGQKAGEVVAKGLRENRIWKVDELIWRGGPGNLVVRNGMIDERGDTHLDGDLQGFQWKWLAPFNPDLAKVAGRSDLSFAIAGRTQSPEITASLSYDESPQRAVITPWPGVAVKVGARGTGSRRVQFDTIRVKDGSMTAEGVFNVEGFTGNVTATLPFRYPFTLLRDEPLAIRATIPDRPIASLSDLLPWLDVNSTEGTFAASVDVVGTLNDPNVRGRFSLGSPYLGLRGQATALRDLSLTADFAEGRVDIKTRGSSSKGGTFESEGLGLTLNNLGELFEDPVAGVLANQLFGTFRLNGFSIEYADPDAGPLTASLSGALEASGTLRQPNITGTILVDSANLAMPTLTAKEETAPSYLIDPKFDVSVISASNLVLRAGTGRFEIVGAGRLEGSLTSPVLSSNLEVAKGSVRLPNARINLEPGGSVVVTYRSGASGVSVSRVEVDLIGRTQVTAQSFTGIVERYDITLTIRGDLLSDNGLQLRAQSDPPDLSSDRILAILGQGDVFANRTGENFRADRQLQSALLGLALPYFAGSLTEQFASRLGLDYLNVEYNQFDQFSLTAAITLGRDLVISGRRQISSPLPGERLKYDLRLSYRPPFRSRALRRFTFSIGTDQDRPWKVSVEYGIKF